MSKRDELMMNITTLEEILETHSESLSSQEIDSIKSELKGNLEQYETLNQLSF